MTEQKTKHTQGPWTVSNNWIVGPDWRQSAGMGPIAKQYGAYLPATEEANARLIAAAPELLEAVRETLRQLDAPDCPSIPDGAMVRGRLYNALAKAEGK